MASSNATYAFSVFWRQISTCPYLRSKSFPPVWNYVLPWRALNRCPMTIHEVIKFSEVDIFLFGSDIRACLIGSHVTPLSKLLAVDPQKRYGKKDFCRASLTRCKTSPTAKVTLCIWKKSHSCWRDFCRPD